MRKNHDRELVARRKLSRAYRGHLLGRNDPFATAFHEAGHCVFREAFGIPVKWVTCRPIISDGKRFLGLTMNCSVSSPVPLHAISTIAGDMAEEYLIVPEEERNDLNPRLSGSDWDVLEEYFKRMPLQEHEILQELQVYVDHTRFLMVCALRWVEAVAIELYVKERLSGDDVRRILTAHGFDDPGNKLKEYRELMWKMAELSTTAASAA